MNVVQAFGNSKTARNNNSSRFGKYMEIEFSKQGVITGGKINKYLLEKTRIVSQAVGERNYHVFFNILYLPESMKQELLLAGKTAEDFAYLNKCGATTVPGIDDEQDLNEMTSAFAKLGISPEEQKGDRAASRSILLLVPPLPPTPFATSARLHVADPQAACG